MTPARSVLYDLGLKTKTVVHVPSLTKYPEKVSSTSGSVASFHKDQMSPQNQVGQGGVATFYKLPGITKSSIKHPCVCLQIQIYVPEQERLCVNRPHAPLCQVLGSPDHPLLR